LIRHLLDAMHCQKNLCENLVRTTFGHKDSYGSCHDMQSEGIRTGLWLQPSNNRKEVFHKLEAPYVLNGRERKTVVEIIKELKTPSNYVGAIHNCIEEGKLRYMKSHDFHILMQEVRNAGNMTSLNAKYVLKPCILVSIKLFFSFASNFMSSLVCW
jgi:hypothetical protein